jgi:ribosomal protein L22
MKCADAKAAQQAKEDDLRIMTCFADVAARKFDVDPRGRARHQTQQ